MGFKLSFLTYLSATILLFGWTTSALPAAPVIHQKARVKQHRAGAKGDLVEGQESLRKILVQWDSVPDALEYEVCHDCIMENGEPKEGEGKRTIVDLKSTRGGTPVHIVPGAPIRINTFHVRAKVATGDGEVWTEWSKPGNYDVHEDTSKAWAEHQEL